MKSYLARIAHQLPAATVDKAALTRLFSTFDLDAGSTGLQCPRHGVEIPTLERTYRVMVRVRICAEIPHRDVPVRGPLDLEGTVVPARREYAVGLTIDEQAQHPMRWIMCAARSLRV